MGVQRQRALLVSGTSTVTPRAPAESNIEAGPERSLLGTTSGDSCARSFRNGAGNGMTEGRDMVDELTRRGVRGRIQVV